MRFLSVVADVLLHLVEDDERGREPIPRRQGVGEGGNQLIATDIRNLRVLRLEQRSRRRLRFREGGVRLEQGLG